MNYVDLEGRLEKVWPGSGGKLYLLTLSSSWWEGFLFMLPGQWSLSIPLLYVICCLHHEIGLDNISGQNLFSEVDISGSNFTSFFDIYKNFTKTTLKWSKKYQARLLKRFYPNVYNLLPKAYCFSIKSNVGQCCNHFIMIYTIRI